MNQQLPINIKRIKEVSFFINEVAIVPNSQRMILLEIGQKLGFSVESNLIELVINIFYFYQDNPQNKLSEIYVQNIFEISNLKSYQLNSNEVKLPSELISVAFQASVAHTRALMSAKLFGTPLEFQLPVLVNGEEIARHFYPQMFDQNVRPYFNYLQ